MNLETAVVWPELPLVVGHKEMRTTFSGYSQPLRMLASQSGPWPVQETTGVSTGYFLNGEGARIQVLAAGADFTSSFPGQSLQGRTAGRPLDSTFDSDSERTSESDLRVSLPFHVANEPFQLEIGQDEHDRFVLHHRNWSLCGFGDTLWEAERDLRETARAIAPVYLDLSQADLTVQTWALREFLLRVL